MLSEVLKVVQDAGISPMISLVMFFVFFVAMFMWAYKANQKELDEISMIPLNDGTTSNNGGLQMDSL